jgi:hypothetical protein
MQSSAVTRCVVVWNNYADTVTLDHGNRQSRDHVSSCRVEVWLYRLRRAGKTRVLEQKKNHLRRLR